jgi:hypothetical protein
MFEMQNISEDCFCIFAYLANYRIKTATEDEDVDEELEQMTANVTRVMAKAGDCYYRWDRIE